MELEEFGYVNWVVFLEVLYMEWGTSWGCSFYLHSDPTVQMVSLKSCNMVLGVNIIQEAMDPFHRTLLYIRSMIS